MDEPRIHSITLRFQGNDLDPAEISAALGAEPTRAGKMSDLDVKTGHWAIQANWQFAGDPEELGMFSPKILDLLSPLSTDLPAWRSISQRFGGGVLCSASISYRAAALFLTTSAMAALSERGLSLSFVARE